MGGAGASADASDSDVPAADLARQVCGRAASASSHTGSGICGTETSGCCTDRARRSRDCETATSDRHRASRKSLPPDAFRDARFARARRDPGGGVDAVRGDAAACGREAAAGFPDPADLVATRARAQALRPRPVHEGAVRLRADRRNSSAGRLCSRAWRRPRYPAVWQHQGAVFPHREPRWEHQPTGARPDPGQRPALRRCALTDTDACDRTDDRHAGQRCDGGSPLDTRVCRG